MRTLLAALFLLAATYGHAQTVTEPPDNTVYTYVEQMPSPPFDLNKYMSEHLHYPDSAKAHGTQGRVIARFTVKADGSLSDIQIIRGIGDGCDEETLRMIKNMPPWKPGKQNGRAVSTYMNIPVTFRIQ